MQIRFRRARCASGFDVVEASEGRAQVVMAPKWNDVRFERALPAG